MAEVAAIGAAYRVAGFGLAGAPGAAAEDPEEVRAAWRDLPRHGPGGRADAGPRPRPCSPTCATRARRTADGRDAMTTDAGPRRHPGAGDRRPARAAAGRPARHGPGRRRGGPSGPTRRPRPASGSPRPHPRRPGCWPRPATRGEAEAAAMVAAEAAAAQRAARPVVLTAQREATSACATAARAAVRDLLADDAVRARLARCSGSRLGAGRGRSSRPRRRRPARHRRRRSQPSTPPWARWSTSRSTRSTGRRCGRRHEHGDARRVRRPGGPGERPAGRGRGPRRSSRWPTWSLSVPAGCPARWSASAARRSSVQAYEYTGGLAVGDPAAPLGRPLSARLGPWLLGGVFDGLLRPLGTRADLAGARRRPAAAPTPTWAVAARPSRRARRSPPGRCSAPSRARAAWSTGCWCRPGCAGGSSGRADAGPHPSERAGRDGRRHAGRAGT